MKLTLEEFNQKYHKTLWHIWEVIARLKKDGKWWKPNGDCYIPWFAARMKEYNHYTHPGSPLVELSNFLKDLRDSNLIDEFPEGVSWEDGKVGINCADVRFPFRLLCDPKFGTPNWGPLQGSHCQPEDVLSSLGQELIELEKRLISVENAYNRLVSTMELNKTQDTAIDTLQHVQRWLQGLLQCVYRRQGEVLELPADSAYYYLDEVTEAIKDSK